MGKLRTTRGKKTSQILCPRHAKCELTSDDNDLAIALSSGSKDLEDRRQELAARVMNRIPNLSSFMNVPDPWFSQLD